MAVLASKSRELQTDAYWALAYSTGSITTTLSTSQFSIRLTVEIHSLFSCCLTRAPQRPFVIGVLKTPNTRSSSASSTAHAQHFAAAAWRAVCLEPLLNLRFHRNAHVSTVSNIEEEKEGVTGGAEAGAAAQPASGAKSQSRTEEVLGLRLLLAHTTTFRRTHRAG